MHTPNQEYIQQALPQACFTLECNIYLWFPVYLSLPSMQHHLIMSFSFQPQTRHYLRIFSLLKSITYPRFYCLSTCQANFTFNHIVRYLSHYLSTLLDYSINFLFCNFVRPFNDIFCFSFISHQYLQNILAPFHTNWG